MDEDKGYQDRYGIIASDDVKEMARMVSEALDENWQLCGDLIVTSLPIGRVLFTQVMTRDKPTIKLSESQQWALNRIFHE